MVKEKLVKILFLKIGQQKVEKVLGATFLLIFIYMLIWIKFLGATDIGIEVEKDGYCKFAYGEDWDYSEIRDVCFYKEAKSFTEKEFREVCPKNKFLSTKFYSSCWKNGDSR